MSNAGLLLSGRVSFVLDGCVLRGRSRPVSHSQFEAVSDGTGPVRGSRVLYYDDEGLWWCLEWEGEAVDALRSVVALRTRAA